jgi:hypothetical protein
MSTRAKSKTDATEILMRSMLDLAKEFEGYEHKPLPEPGIATRAMTESTHSADAIRYMIETMDESESIDADYRATRKVKNQLLTQIQKAKKAGDKTSVGQNWQANVNESFAAKLMCENEARPARMKRGGYYFTIPMQADAHDISIDFDLVCVIDGSIQRKTQFKIIQVDQEGYERKAPDVAEKDQQFTDLLREL